MKILFLNLWHGKLQEPLRKFLEAQHDVDIFCFQEAKDADEVLPAFLYGYQKYAVNKHVAQRVGYSQATYVRRDYEVKGVKVLLEDNKEMGLALCLTLDVFGRLLDIVNIHGVSRAFRNGVWQAQDDKADFPIRIQQSERILAFAEKQQGSIVIGGDFNILPDTKSLEVLRQAGYQDLIQSSAISTTRNHYSWEKYPENERYYHSDYVFVSPTLRVQSFEVPQVEVSDHLPMIVQVEFLGA